MIARTYRQDPATYGQQPSPATAVATAAAVTTGWRIRHVRLLYSMPGILLLPRYAMPSSLLEPRVDRALPKLHV